MSTTAVFHHLLPFLGQMNGPLHEWTLTQCTFRNENQFLEIGNENN